MSDLIVRVTGASGPAQNITLEPGRTGPTRIKVARGQRIELVDPKTMAAPESIVTKRVGSDLRIKRKAGDDDNQDLVIEGYYNDPVPLTGQTAAGQAFEYAPQGGGAAGSVAQLADAATAVQTAPVTTATAAAAAPNPYLWPALGGLGLVGLAAGGGGGGDSGPAPAPPPAAARNVAVADADADGRPEVTGTAAPGSTVVVTLPDGTTRTATADASTGNFSIEVSPANNQSSGSYTVTVRDAAGNSSPPSTVAYTDRTAPVAPGAPAVTTNANGTITVSGPAGSAEPGSTVSVTFPDGTTASTTAAADGSYPAVTSAAPQPSGSLSTRVTDAAGNAGPPTSTAYADVTAPPATAAPTVTANPNGTLTVAGGPGAAEPGTTVTVTFPDGTTATRTAAADGSYAPVTSTAPQTSGTVSTRATDAAGNAGPATATPYTDGSAPVAPSAPVIAANPNGTVSVSGGPGSAEPGATVTATFPDGSTGTATVAADGSFPAITSAAPQTSGTVSVRATDAAGNASASVPTAFVSDTTAPPPPGAPTVTANPNGTLSVSGGPGTAEPGSTVTLTFPDGSTGSATAGADGSYPAITSAAPQTSGTVSTRATDAAGNTSTSTAASYTDTTAPTAPAAPTVAANPGGTVTVSGGAGSAEPGSTVRVTFPDGSTAVTTAAADGSFQPLTSGTPQPSGTVSVSAADAAGNTSPATSTAHTVDTTAPPAPGAPTITANPNGTLSVSGGPGAAEPGSTVSVTFPDGSTGTATAAADGSFPAITSTAPQTSGTVSTTATDTAGNQSPATTTAYTDTTAPAAPGAPTVAANPGGTVTVSGPPGTAEPGATLTVTFPNGSTATVTTAADGSFPPVTSTTPQAAGPVTVAATDAAGNTGPVTSVPYAPDTTAPPAPGAPTITANPDGTVTVSGPPGTAEPGSTVTVTFPNGSTATTTAAADGSYPAVTSTTPQSSGPVATRATDAAGNVGPVSNTPFNDGTAPAAPAAPTIVSNPNGTLSVSGGPGSAEPGTTVTVTFPNGSTAVTSVAPDGSFPPVTSTTPQPSGTVSVRATDAAGNTSATTSAPYVADSVAPAAPGAPTLTANADGTLTVSGGPGTAEPGSTVTVTFPDGTTATTTAAADGSYPAVTSANPQSSGTVSTRATDVAGNASPVTATAYADTTAPVAPGAPTVVANPSGTVTVSGPAGSAEPGSTVTVTFPDGSTATTTAAADGSFQPLTSATPQPSGTVSVTAADAAGNASPATTSSYTADTTPPAAPGTPTVTANPNGTLSVSGPAGSAEPGSTVTVTFPNGSTGTAVAAADGSYPAITSATPQTSGTVSVTATDPLGNTSAATTTPYADTTAPTAPAAPTVTANPNNTVTVSGPAGSAEPGSTVTITFPNGSTATVTAAADGSFPAVTSATPQASGNVSVVATDAAGNASTPTSVAYAADSTPPAAPGAPTVTANPNGTLTVSGPEGSAEPGSTVTVTFPDGSSAVVTAAADGSYPAVTSAAPQTSGNVVTTATDAAGNTSPATNTPYTDSTAPAAPGAPTVTANPNGTLSVSGGPGAAEPGSTVTVTFPDGSTGTATAAADGSFPAITSAAPQTSGTVSTTATDAAGNASPVTTASYTDSAAPAAPAAPTVTANPNGTLSVSGGPGSVEPGSTVTVTFPDGSTGTATAAADGSYPAITSAAPQTSGTVSTTATDAAGNASLATTASYADSTAPAAPGAPTVTANPNGTLGVSGAAGSAEPGSTVTVTFPDGSTGTAVAAADGSYAAVTSAAPQTSGTVSTTATDVAGNVSPATTATYTDATAPTAPGTPTVTANPNGTLSVSGGPGSAEPGSTVTVTFPDGSTGTAAVAADGSFTAITSAAPQTSGTVSTTATDAAGNTSPATTATYTDSTAPAAPGAPTVTANPNGTLSVSGLAGSAEPGSTVTVTFPDGSTGTATAAADGSYPAITSASPQPSGTVSTTVTDAAGNASAPTTSAYTDSTPPAAPGAPTVTANPNGTLSVSGGPGTAEPGSTVTVTFPDGSIGTAIAAADGSYATVTSATPQTSGTVVTTAADASGNTSPATSASYTDSTAPVAPGTPTVTANPDGTLSVSGPAGSAEPGSTVTVTFPDGSTGTATAAADGSFPAVTSATPQTSGTVSTTATDAAGNASPATTTTYTDTTAPAFPALPTLTANPDGTLSVSGTAGSVEPGSTVTVTFRDGSSGTTVAAADGSYAAITSTTPQASGRVAVSATDAAGNESLSAVTTYIDITPPLAPGVPTITANPNGTLSVTGAAGTAEPGSTVTVVFPDGSTGQTVAAADGSYAAVTSAAPQTSGTVSTTARDAAGNTSPATTAAYTDATAPVAPGAPTVTANPDATLNVSGAAGSAEPGSTVTVTFPDGTTGTTTAAADGSYGPVTSAVPQTSGTVSTTARDAAGNTSPVTTATYTDSTAPTAPGAPTITANPNGTLSVTGAAGTAEPGSTVTVTFPDGTTGTAVAAADGSYGPVTSTAPQTSGTVSTTARDAAGNTSPVTTATYTDSTAPAAPSTPTVTANSNGTLGVSGTAEPGSTVTVTFPDGTTGTAVAAADGSYGPVTSTAPQTSGTVSTTATDAAGNASAPTTAAYTDSTAPTAPGTPTVTANPNGTLSVTGTAEPGSTVTVTFPDGSTGTAVAAADGSYGPVASATPQTSGTLSTTARDAAGNTSPATTATYTDGTAPTAPGTPTVTANPNGTLSVSGGPGTAEPGSTVTVTFPDGSTGTAAAAADGSYAAVTSAAPQTSGTVSTTARDAAGNTSPATTATYTDSTAPSAPGTPTVTANPNGTLSVSGAAGSAEPGSTVTVTFPDGSTGTAIAAANGSYGPVTSTTPQTSGTVSTTATDAAGNTSPATSTPYTDTTPPVETGTVASFADNVGAVQNAAAASGTSTDDTAPVLSGTLSAALVAGDVLNIYRDGVLVGAATVAGTSWTFADTGLADGSYVYTARVADPAGNLGTASAGFTVTVDTAAPTITGSIGSYADDAGTVLNPAAASGSTTDDASPTLSGTLAAALGAGESLQVLRNGVLVGTATATGTSWTFADSAVPEGLATYTVRVVDAAGNAGVASSDFTLTVDTTAPTQTATIASLSDDVGVVQNPAAPSGTVTDDTAPVLNGTLSAGLGAGEVLNVFRDGVLVGNATVTGSTWTYAETALADGSYSYTVRVADAAGNVAAASTPFAVTVDTIAPTGTTVLDLATASDNGASTTDNLTSVSTPTITGTVSGMSAADVAAANAGQITATVFIDANANDVLDAGERVLASNVAITASGTDGTFSTALGMLYDGSYRIRSVMLDGTGNASTAGALDGSVIAQLQIDSTQASGLVSTQANDGLGYDVSSAGDFNGDGIEDFIVTAPHGQFGANAFAQSDAYVVYGTRDGLPTTADIDSLSASQALRINNTGTFGDAGIQGHSGTTIGDLNGDGFDDIVISSNLNDSAYVIFGRASATPSINLSSMNSGSTADGFRIVNFNTGAWFGTGTGGGHDYNGDGYDDLLIGSSDGGATEAPSGGATPANGGYYVLYGRAGSGAASWTNLQARLDGLFDDVSNTQLAAGTHLTVGAGGGLISAYNDSWLGDKAQDVGDVNGDGYHDYVVTAPLYNPGTFEIDRGAAVLMFGGPNGLSGSGLSDFNLINLTPTQGVVLTGAENFENLGGVTSDGGNNAHGDAWFGNSNSVSTVGDINGDGLADFAIGSPEWGDGLADSFAPGRVYVVFGRNGGWTGGDLSTLASGSSGFTLTSTGSTNANLGNSIRSTGDVNGDGIDDFLIGASNADSSGDNDSGAAYVVFGRAGGGFASTSLETMVANGEAIKYTGAPGDFMGTNVGMGDWNGDGIQDYAFGRWEAGATDAGRVDMYQGSVARLTLAFTVGNDTLAAGGTTAGAPAIVNGVDRISGGLGNDTITGIGTDTTGTTATSTLHDVAYGGGGNDLISLAGTVFTRVDGGQGIDTLQLQGTGLSLNVGTYGERIQGFERYDLGTAGQGNTLTLSLADVLTSSDNAHTLGHVEVQGDASSRLVLTEGASQWNFTGTTAVSAGITYDVWRNSTAVNAVGDVWVQQGVIVGNPVTVLDLTTASDSGVSTDNVTNVGTPTITGRVTGMSAADVALANAGDLRATVFVDSNGNGALDGGEQVLVSGLQVTADRSTGTFSTTLPLLFDGSYAVRSVLVNGASQTYAGALDGNPSTQLVIDSGAASTMASTQSNDGLGYEVSSAGDFNGDGIEDFMVTAPHGQYGANAFAQSDVYVVYGTRDGLPTTADIDSLTAAQALRINNSGTFGDVGIQGHNGTTIGDLNGDGFDDIVISSALNDAAYVIFGRAAATPSISLSSMNSGSTADGFRIVNFNTGGWFGTGAGGGHDYNGDGYDDLLIGSADGSATDAPSGAFTVGNGSYYILYGHAGSGGTAWTNLQARTTGLFDDTTNTQLGAGTHQLVSGGAVAAYTDSWLGERTQDVGDVNGDGYHDYVVTAPLYNPDTFDIDRGAAILMFGGPNGLSGSSLSDFNLSSLTASQGVVLNGTENFENLGGVTIDWGNNAHGDMWFGTSNSISSVGDINGDGLADFAIGSPEWGDGLADGFAPGRVYVVFGRNSGWSSGDLSTLASGSSGFILTSTGSTNANLGSSIRSTGDVNGDGIDDFLVGASNADSSGDNDSGAAYVVFGRAGGGFASTSLETMVANGEAIKYTGAPGDFMGTNVGMGDWNGDGIQDYAIGRHETGTTDSGQVDIYRGSVARLTQGFTVGNDVLAAGGTSFGAAAIVNGVDRISGGLGNDTLTGIGTDTTGTTATSTLHDVAYGGSGNDLISLAGLVFTRVNGGQGIDTLQLQGTGLSLNLATYGERVQGFERFDLGGAGQGNTLTLRLSDVLNQSENTAALGHIEVTGDATGTLDLVDGNGTWSIAGNVTVDGITYNIWRHSTLSNTLGDVWVQVGVVVI